MAILYDWYENPGESDDSEEKGLHPRIFLNGKVGTDKLCRMIHGRSSLSVGDVKNAFEMLAQICGEELREGREVHIEGLGYFAPILRSTQKVTRSTKNKWLKMELKTIGFVPTLVCGENLEVLKSAGASMHAIRNPCRQWR